MHNENKSRQTQTSSTSVSNLNVQDTEGVTVAGNEGPVNVYTTDQRLADAAEAMASEALRVGGNALTDAFDVSRDVVDHAGRSIKDAFGFADNLAADVIAESADTRRDTFEFTTDTLDMGERLVGNMRSFTEGLFGDAVEAVTGVVKESQAQLGNTVSNINTIARQQATSSDERVQNIAEKALYAAGAMVALLMIGTYMMKRA